MSFRFPLQKIVDLKGNQKTQAEWLLSEALVVLREEQRSLSELREEQQDQHERLMAAASNPTPIVQIQSLQEYTLHLERLIERKLVDVSSAQQQVEGKQQLLLERSLDEKVWTKAREKAHIAHTALELKKEQDMLDEMTSARFGFQ